MQVPEARKTGLVIQEFQDEVLVYDLNSHKAHCLNQTAMLVWNSCNGKNNISEIAELLEEHFGQRVDEEVVSLAIDQLLEKDLLLGKVGSGMKERSRREWIKRIGLATAVALPQVASLVAPTSVMASSTCLCQTNADCLTQVNCGRDCVNGVCRFGFSCLCPTGPGPSGNAQCSGQPDCGSICNASGLCV